LLPLAAVLAEMQPLVVIPTLVLSQLFVLLVGLVQLPLTVTLLLVVRAVVQQVVKVAVAVVQVVTASQVETAGRTLVVQTVVKVLALVVVPLLHQPTAVVAAVAPTFTVTRLVHQRAVAPAVTVAVVVLALTQTKTVAQVVRSQQLVLARQLLDFPRV